jgi:hypothetical protein
MSISTSPTSQVPEALLDPASAPAKQASSNVVPPAADTNATAQATEEVSNAKPAEPLTDVSMRLDSNGRIYYVVSDPTSGQEILEVPPKAVRNVEQGIADYVKEQQSKASAHVKVSA